jgi:glycogen synthase kinase 3 beta
MGPTGERVALKKVKRKESLPREVQILQTVHSPCCNALLDHFSSVDGTDSYLWLVTELMPESLGNFIRRMHQLHETVHPLIVKLFTYQLFAGLAHLHSLGICHRDIKTDNCLVDAARGRLVISDFGSAKVLDKDGDNAFYIASRIYRAPELLLNCTTYDNTIDIWAAGCVIAEILLDAIPMWQGASNDEQLIQIMQVLGPPAQGDSQSFMHPQPFPEVECISSLHYALPLSTPTDLLDLLGRIFNYNPKNRPSAEECMRSPYFDELFKDGVKLPSGNSLPPIPRRPL